MAPKAMKVVQYPYTPEHDFYRFSIAWVVEDRVPVGSRRDMRDEIIDWCKENFGLDSRLWYYNPGMGLFSIKRYEDALAFRMRWC